MYTRNHTHLHCFYCRVLTRAATTETAQVQTRLSWTLRELVASRKARVHKYILYVFVYILYGHAQTTGVLVLCGKRCAQNACRLTRHSPAFPFPGGTCFPGISLYSHRGECRQPELPSASSQGARDLSRIPMPFLFRARTRCWLVYDALRILHQIVSAPVHGNRQDLNWR